MRLKTHHSLDIIHYLPLFHTLQLHRDRKIFPYRMTDPKPRPNHRLYLQTLRAMTPEARLLKAFELSEFSRQLFKEGLRNSFPTKTEAELHALYLQRLEKCHNRNY